MSFKMPPLHGRVIRACKGMSDGHFNELCQAIREHEAVVLETVAEMVRNISVAGGQVHMRQAILDELRAALEAQRR